MLNPKDLVSEEQIDQQIAAGHLQPIEAPVINPNAPRTGPVVPGNSGRDPHESGSLPPNFGLSTDLYRTDYGGSVPEDRVMPIAPAATPQINAAAQSIATHIVNEAIAAIPVVPAVTAATDGVIHGSPFWESDPAYFVMREDFVPMGSANVGSIGTTALTAAGWALGGDFGLAGVAGTFYMGAPPYLGQLMWTNTGTINQSALTCPIVVGNPAGSSAGQLITGYWPLLDYPSWQCSFVFKFDMFPQSSSTAAFSTAGTSFYVGLSGDTRTAFRPSSVGLSRPRSYIGLRFDTDTNAPSINDSFFTLEVVNNPETSGTYARNNTQGTTFVTNVAPVAGVWHRLDIVCTAAGKVTLTLDGSSTNTLTATMPKTIVSIPGGVAAAASTNNGAFISWSSTSTAPIGNWANGSQIAITGITDVGYTFLNGPWVITQASESPNIEFITTASIANTTLTSAPIISGYPGLTPFMAMGNDNTVAIPTGCDKAIFIDFFSLLWNPGVNPSNSLTPNSNLPRYW